MITQEFDEMAALMDMRMRQLATEGVSSSITMDRMMGFVLQLLDIWGGTTEGERVRLFAKYPGFCSFASLAIQLTDTIERAFPAFSASEPDWPDTLKESLSAVFASGAALEAGYQACVDASEQDRVAQQLSLLEALHCEWLRDVERVLNELRSFGVPHAEVMHIIDRLEETKRRLGSQEARVLARVSPPAVSGHQ